MPRVRGGWSISAHLGQILRGFWSGNAASRAGAAFGGIPLHRARGGSLPAPERNCVGIFSLRHPLLIRRSIRRRLPAGKASNKVLRFPTLFDPLLRAVGTKKRQCEARHRSMRSGRRGAERSGRDFSDHDRISGGPCSLLPTAAL
jgi:hypothetical protein